MEITFQMNFVIRMLSAACRGLNVSKKDNGWCGERLKMRQQNNSQRQCPQYAYRYRPRRQMSGYLFNLHPSNRESGCFFFFSALDRESVAFNCNSTLHQGTPLYVE
jgi:hypothetical protein